jgi:PEP-CTERM motif
MKLATSLRAFSILVIVSLSCLAAYADSDPRVIIRDAPPGHGVQEDFSFSLPGKQGQSFTGDLSFTNRTDQTWTSLALFFVPTPTFTYSCSAKGSGIFNYCDSLTDPQNSSLTEFLFENVAGMGKLGTGILPCENFTFGFSGTTGGAQWASGTKFTAVAAVPEPATLAFLLTGIAAIVARRKLWKRASLSFLNTR